jgi:hypothetical protein
VVRRRLSRSGRALIAGLLAAAVTACGADRDMARSADMPDTAQVQRALTERQARDSMLDTLPGGEMARGDTAAARKLLSEKMP